MVLRIILSGIMITLLLFSALAQDSVVPVHSELEAGVGFSIGAGNVLVTSARLGSSISCNEVVLESLGLYPVRGIGLFRLDRLLLPLELAEKAVINSSEEYAFLIPYPIPAETVVQTNDPARSKVTGEAWLVKTSYPVPPGAPLVRESDQLVMGVAIHNIEDTVVAVSVDRIRLCCFDAGLPLARNQRQPTSARIVRNWPYTGFRAREFHLSDLRRLEAWRDIVGLLPTYSTSIVTAGNHFYLGDREGRVFSVDSKKRTLVWSQNLDWPVIFPPVIAGDTLYVTIFGLQLEMQDNSFIFRNRHWSASGVSILYAFNRHTGEIRWRHITGLRSAPIVQDGLVYFGGLGGYGVLKSETGESVWINGNPLTREERPFWYLINAPVGDTIYVVAVKMRLLEKLPQRILLASGEIQLLEVEAKTGAVRSKIKLGKVRDSQHPFATACHLQASENIITIAVGEVLRGYDISNGKLLWEKALPGMLVPGAVGEGNAFFLSTDKPQVQAVDVLTGNPLWNFDGLTGIPGYLLAHDDSIVFGALDSQTYELSAETGECLWSLECPGGKISGGPAYLNNTFLFAASDGRVYVIAPPLPTKAQEDETLIPKGNMSSIFSVD